MLAGILLLASALGIFKGFIFVAFVFVALLLVLVVLLQEPKGGGLSGAFGGVGAETFGVQTGGVNRFTSYLAALFLGLAIMYAAIREEEPAAPSDYERDELTVPIGGGEPADEPDTGDSDDKDK